MLTVVLSSDTAGGLSRQLAAVRAQTAPPEQVLVWHAGAGPSPDVPDAWVAHCSHPLGRRARLAYALNAETPFICLLDPGVAPAPELFEAACRRLGEAPLLVWDGDTLRGAPELAPEDDGQAWFVRRDALGSLLPPVVDPAQGVTVVLNAFRRQGHLDDQIAAVFAQSEPVARVLVWNNGAPLPLPHPDARVVLVNHNENLGVWARFAFALNATTAHVCLLDDDTFPAPRFFASCLEQMERAPALLGARGLRFLRSDAYTPARGFGWREANDERVVVDIVGHAWFARRSWLTTFWRELPGLGTSRLVGEDMHFSFMLQKHEGVPTAVPPHPRSDPSIWGSDPKRAVALGEAREAVSQNEHAMARFDAALQRCTDAGFELLKDRAGEKPGVAIGPGVGRIPLVKTLVARYPRLGRIGLAVQRALARRNIHI